MKKNLSKNEILRLLESINDELAQKEIYGEILLVGGAALSLVHNARDSTYDIDGIFEPKNEISDIAQQLSLKHDLEADWLNDAAKGFISPQMEKRVYKEYSNLTILAVEAKPLLAMKLISARQGSSDMRDALFLMKQIPIKTEAELFDIISRYTNPHHQTAKAHFFTKEVFAAYQKEKERIEERER